MLLPDDIVPLPMHLILLCRQLPTNRVNREILDEDLTEMLRNNPPDVVYTAFAQAFFQGAIRMFQRDNEMRNIVLTDAQAREKATRHFFNRALREARENAR